MISRAPAGSHPGFISGNWYNPLPGVDVAGGGAAGTGTIKLMPFYVPKPLTISQLAIRITTLAAGGNCQLAIYAHNTALGRPTGAALCNTASITTASAGNVSAAAASPMLTPGLYWMAVNQDNATVAYQSINNSVVVGAYYVGSATLGNVNQSAAAAAFALSIAQAYGTWPDLTGASFTETNPSGHGVVYFKAA